MTPTQSLYRYRELRKGFYGRTSVYTKGLHASMHAMDMTEDYYLWVAQTEVKPLPLKAEYLEKIRRTRAIALVNMNAIELWRSAKKHFSIKDFFAQLVV